MMTLKYIENLHTTPLTSPNARHELSTSIASILHNCPPSTPWHDGFKNTPRGLWTGPTSIAYLFLWLSHLQPDIVCEGKSALQWCQAYLDCGQQVVPLDDKECGIKNEYLAFSAVAACASHLRSPTASNSFVARLVQGVQEANERTREDYNEYLSGRAGTLFLLRLVRAFIPSAKEATTSAMTPLITHILTHRPWNFNGVEYTGAAHGSIGIITQIVLSDPSYANCLEPELLKHLEMQPETGHWYVRAIPDEAELVQFCHGAPGFIISLLALRSYFPALHERIDKAIELGRQDVWRRGVLRKEPNLCHGVSGNALALTGEKRKAMMAHATRERIQAGLESGEYEKGDDRWGLGWGEPGRAWAWMVMLCEETQERPMFAAYTDV